MAINDYCPFENITFEVVPGKIVTTLCIETRLIEPAKKLWMIKEILKNYLKSNRFVPDKQIK